MTTQTTNPLPTAATMNQLREHATKMQAITDTIGSYLDNDLPQEWATFMTHALSQAGLKSSGTYDYADLSHGNYPAITPGADGITYSGEIYYQGNGSEPDSYTIPWGFINPASRSVTETEIHTALREEKVEKDAQAVKNAEVQAEHQHKEKVRQLERLAADLGMKVTEA